MLFELLFAAPENIGFNPPDGIEYLMFVAFFFFIFFWSLLKESDLPYRFFGTTRSEVHPSEETELVLKILILAGFTLKDPNLYQAAAGEDIKNTQQEKQ